MKIIARPRYEVEFALPLQTLELLQRCAKSHYDHRCRQAGSPSGFISKWIRITENMQSVDIDPRISGEFNEFDTCLKIMEMMHHLGYAEQCELAMVSALFTRILLKVNDLYIKGIAEWESNAP